MSILKDLHPRLREEDESLSVVGRRVIEEELKTLIIRWGIRISSAIKCEMATTQCTYEEACVRFVQACDQVSATFHYINVASEIESGTNPDALPPEN